jgi:cytoplasmic tRNA 2-thiolation protein 1
MQIISTLDSTVLAHVLTLLNARHDYGLDLFLLSIDEGITGYRDDSLEVQPPLPNFPFCSRCSSLSASPQPLSIADSQKEQGAVSVTSEGVPYSPSHELPQHLLFSQCTVQILSYRDLYGWSMDDIVRVIGLRNNCTSAIPYGVWEAGLTALAPH